MNLTGGAQSVLLVEDDEALRKLAQRHLAKLGYDVVAAADGSAALEIFDSGTDVDLLMTDVVLPGGMTGIDLVNRIEKKFPLIHTLFVSGYGKEALADFGVEHERYVVLAKPYNRNELALAIWNVIDKADLHRGA